MSATALRFSDGVGPLRAPASRPARGVFGKGPAQASGLPPSKGDALFDKVDVTTDAASTRGAGTASELLGAFSGLYPSLTMYSKSEPMSAAIVTC
jgi:hypothetical protein